jgi:hypothetical protein
MIPIEKLRAITHVVVHNDADGIASAMIFKDVLPEVKVSVVAYNSPEHDNMPAEPGMAFCDFSPAQHRIEDFVKAGTIVLDHHDKQKDIVDAFGELGVFGENAKVEAGAFLAYREVWLPLMDERWQARRGIEGGQSIDNNNMVTKFDLLKQRVEHFATLVSIRDTWQTKHELWLKASEQSEALHFWPDEKLLSGIPSEDWGQLFDLGPMLFKRKLKAAQRCIDGGRQWTSAKGTKCIAFVGIYQVSDAAEILDDTDIDLVLAFTYYLQEGKPFLRMSCRSHTGWDVGAFARTFPGGGGHKASSGFQAEFSIEGNDANDGWQEAAPNPYRHIKCLVDTYEASDAFEEAEHGS